MTTPTEEARAPRSINEGLDRAPHRAFLRATGLDDERHRQAVRRHRQPARREHAVLDVARAAGRCRAARRRRGAARSPVPFTTISVSDGVSMNHRGMRMSLVSRELIADSIEAVMRAHAYDALVGFAGCDKTLPGVMMAMVRAQRARASSSTAARCCPATGAASDVTILTTYEGVGAVLAGRMTEAELDELGHACAPTLGSCPGQFTANTMAMVVGDARPRAARLGDAARRLRRAPRARAPRRPARCRDRRATAGRCRATSSRASRSRTPAAAVAATGGSTNAGLHLPAIAHEAGIRFTLDDVAEVFARTPLIADLQPGGEYLARRPAPRRRRAAGAEGAARRRLPARRRARAVRPHARRRARAQRRRPTARSCAARRRALHPTGGVVVLKGNLAPDGALIKIAGPEVERRVRRPGARLRVRGGCVRRGHRATLSRPATCS